MYWILGLMTLSLVGLIAVGLYFELRPVPPRRAASRWLKGGIAANLLSFVLAEAALLFLGLQDALAQAPEAPAREISVGLGLALIGIGIPTGLATVGAGIAVSAVGAASLAAITEKPEIFGRTLVYLGLAEGIAIYGLVVTILMLGQI